MKQRGFTVIELLVVITALIAIGAVFFVQKSQYESMNRDDKRRTAINAMYHNLEDVYFVKHGSYPKALNKDTLTAMDSALLTDPSGTAIGAAGSDYHYDPLACENDACKGYTLRANLENEADYTKKNR